MPLFKYKAIDGEKNTKSGLVEAATEDVAIDTLKDKGYAIISISQERDIKSYFDIPFINSIDMKDLVIFSRQFSVMISANVAIVQALRILIDQTDNVKLRMIISQVADEVDSGYRLSDALGKRPTVFSNFFVSVVRSGETSGRLEEVLDYLANEMEKDFDMNNKIKGAMVYPAFVFCGLIVVGMMMMIFVVPKLTSILTESGGQLPFATRLLIGTSAFMVSYWWIILLVFILLIFGGNYALRRPEGKELFDKILLRLPIFGNLFQKIYLVRFTRTMNTLIVGGVTIVDSLKVSAEVAGNVVYKKLIEETIIQVEEGNSISGVFAANKQVPKMVSQMIGIGEKTGKLDIVLDRVTHFYMREIDNIIANLMTLLEPIVMVVMGVAVGLMVAAIILPMYNLAGQV